MAVAVTLTHMALQARARNERSFKEFLVKVRVGRKLKITNFFDSISAVSLASSEIRVILAPAIAVLPTNRILSVGTSGTNPMNFAFSGLI